MFFGHQTKQKYNLKTKEVQLMFFSCLIFLVQEKRRRLKLIHFIQLKWKLSIVSHYFVKIPFIVMMMSRSRDVPPPPFHRGEWCCVKGKWDTTIDANFDDKRNWKWGESWMDGKKVFFWETFIQVICNLIKLFQSYCNFLNTTSFKYIITRFFDVFK